MPSVATMRAESKDVPFSLLHLVQSIFLTSCCLGQLAKQCAEKGAGLQRMQLHCPPACAGLLLGGTCDEVLTVSVNHCLPQPAALCLVPLRSVKSTPQRQSHAVFQKRFLNSHWRLA